MSSPLAWNPPPNWPQAPQGWAPPPGWVPPPDWPPAPAGWQFMIPAPARPERPAPLATFEGAARKDMARETRWVMVAFLWGAITSAVVIFAQHLQTGRSLSQFANLTPGHPLTNLFLAILAYLPVMAVVPITLLLLSRTGQGPSALVMVPRSGGDFGGALLIAAAGFGIQFALAVELAPLLRRLGALVNNSGAVHLPLYYIAYGLAVSAATAITEETIVNAYLLTRLEQLGWSPGRALLLSLALRTSYHVYYGISVIFTIPLGYLVTRSFQKRRRLGRAIAAHFLYDAAVFLITLLQ